MAAKEQNEKVKDGKVKNRKSENFLRLSKERVNKIIDAVALLENLSNTNLYSYTDEQIETMFSAIEESLDSAKESFRNKKPRQKFDWK